MGRADNYGIYRNGLAKVGTGAAIAVTGYLAYQELFGVVPSNPSNNPYPALHSALYKSSAIPFDGSNRKVGDVVIYDGLARKITSVIYLDAHSASTCLPSGASNSGITLYHVSVYDINTDSTCSDGSKGRKAYIDAYQFQNVAMPDFTPAPANETASKLGLSELYPQYINDIDKLIAAHPHLLNLPSTLNQDIQDAKKQVLADAAAASTAKTLESLRAIRDAAKAKYDADPSQSNKDALDKAEADLAKVEKEAAEDELTAIKEKEEEDKLSEEKQVEEETVLTPPEPPELLKIDLTPLIGVGDDLSSKFPFTLLATLRNFASGLVASPVAPVFTISFPAPFNYDWTFDCSRFDGIAQMVRVLIGMAFLAYCTMFLIRRWR